MAAHTQSRLLRISLQAEAGGGLPILCRRCVVRNPYGRMSRYDLDRDCILCHRPFTVFRWRAGRDGRFNKTVACKTCCASPPHCCQICLVNLDYIPRSSSTCACASANKDDRRTVEPHIARLAMRLKAARAADSSRNQNSNIPSTTTPCFKKRAPVCGFSFEDFKRAVAESESKRGRACLVNPNGDRKLSQEAKVVLVRQKPS